MEHVSVYLHDILDFFRDGFRDGFAHVNGALGLIIAVFAAYMMTEWKRIWAVALGATVAHLISVIMIPVLANERSFQLFPRVLLRQDPAPAGRQRSARPRALSRGA